MTEADGMAFVVDDDAALRHSMEGLRRSVGLRVEVFASAQDFLPYGAIFRLRLPVGAASRLWNIALNSSSNAA
jgi:FixJ family two-component response regulator